MALDGNVRSFLARHVDDLESLDVLLLLHRKRTAWTPAEVAEELGLDATLVEDRLAHLCSIGLLTSETGERFTWAPASAELANVVDRLAEAYRSSRRLVLDEVAGPGPLRSFSEAFRIRSRKNSDG